MPWDGHFNTLSTNNSLQLTSFGYGRDYFIKELLCTKRVSVWRGCGVNPIEVLWTASERHSMHLKGSEVVWKSWFTIRFDQFHLAVDSSSFLPECWTFRLSCFHCHSLYTNSFFFVCFFFACTHFWRDWFPLPNAVTHDNASHWIRQLMLSRRKTRLSLDVCSSYCSTWNPLMNSRERGANFQLREGNHFTFLVCNLYTGT